MSIMAVLGFMKGVGLILIGAGLFAYAAGVVIERRRKDRKD